VPRDEGRRLQALTVIAGKAVQRIAELVERQRLDVKLDVGALLPRIGAREDAELRRRHGQRPAPAKRYSSPISRAA
jgi:hypothetical protein